MVLSWLLVIAGVISSIASEPIIRGSNVERPPNGQTENEQPFTVYMEIAQRTPTEPKLIHNAGGILIGPKIVLTAAHVLVVCGELTSIFVIAGATDLDIENYQRNFAKYYRIHNDFGGVIENSPTFVHNDIALIWLHKKFVLNHNVKLAKIPNQRAAIPGKRGWAAGWGTTEIERVSAVLKKVELEVISFGSCERFYTTTLNGNNFCAKSLKPDTGVAPGDSGGPLVVHGVVIGLISQGTVNWQITPNGEKTKVPVTSVPTVFTDIFKFNQWITWNIRDVANKPVIRAVKKVTKVCRRGGLNFLRKVKILKPPQPKEYPAPILI